MSDRTFLLHTGLDTPDDRFEAGTEVSEADLPEKSIGWLERIGAIEEVASAPIDATDGALKLADTIEDLDLADVKGTGAKGTGAKGRVTKEDVEKFLAAREESGTDG